MTYDSRPDTYAHSQRVGELMNQLMHELLDRSQTHDRSKTVPPEVHIFDEFTPRLKTSTYGSEEYKGYLTAMSAGLQHHYANNRHHPEHFSDGINGMTLVDLIEMLADWKAATERHDNGDLGRSLAIQQTRFGIGEQLTQILVNTARYFGWLYQQCGSPHRAPDGTNMVCNVPLNGLGWHWGSHGDGRYDGGQYEWWETEDGHPEARKPIKALGSPA